MSGFKELYYLQLNKHERVEVSLNPDETRVMLKLIGKDLSIAVFLLPSEWYAFKNLYFSFKEPTDESSEC